MSVDNIAAADEGDVLICESRLRGVSLVVKNFRRCNDIALFLDNRSISVCAMDKYTFKTLATKKFLPHTHIAVAVQVGFTCKDKNVDMPTPLKSCE